MNEKKMAGCILSEKDIGGKEVKCKIWNNTEILGKCDKTKRKNNKYIRKYDLVSFFADVCGEWVYRERMSGEWGRGRAMGECVTALSEKR